MKEIINKVICADSLEIMNKIPDKSIDLILTDPDYGIYSQKKVTGFAKKRIDFGIKNLGGIPDKKYFDEIFRISKNQIIWGYNYLADFLGKCVAPIVWDKKTGDNYFADGELAWTSFQTGTLRIFRHQWCGCFKDSERNIKAKHPTQKPIALFSWLLAKFCKENNLILDPFAGSGTTAIAALENKMQYILIEKEKKYVDVANNRIKLYHQQCKFF